MVKLATDLSLPEREMYENELKKVNKLKEIQHQVEFDFKNNYILLKIILA